MPLATGNAPAQSTSTGSFVECLGMLAKTPSWVFILVIGMAGFAAVSLLPAKKFAPNTLDRAVWCSLQIGAGVFLIMAAQFWAVLRIAPFDEKVSFKDIFLPFRLWGLVFQHMPALRIPVWLAGFGVSLIVSALVLVGGLSYWMRYMPKAKRTASASHISRLIQG